MTSVDARGSTVISTDVLVVGGGAVGVAAAVVAARQGVRVTLVERYGFCGGGAVAGMSGTVCGMYLAADDPAAPPRQVVWGFLDEFVRAIPGATREQAETRLSELAVRVEKQPLRFADALIPVGISYGLSSYDGSADLPTLLRDCDRAMYLRKQARRD